MTRQTTPRQCAHSTRRKEPSRRQNNGVAKCEIPEWTSLRDLIRCFFRNTTSALGAAVAVIGQLIYSGMHTRRAITFLMVSTCSARASIDGMWRVLVCFSSMKQPTDIKSHVAKSEEYPGTWRSRVDVDLIQYFLHQRVS